MWNCSNYKTSDTYYSLQSCIHGLSSSARHVDLNSSHARWLKANFASVGNNTWRRHSGREEAHSYSRRTLSVTSIHRRCGRCCKNPSPSLLETTSWELLTGDDDDDDSRRLPSGFARMTTASSTIWPCCCCCQQTSNLLFVLLVCFFRKAATTTKDTPLWGRPLHKSTKVRIRVLRVSAELQTLDSPHSL